MNFGLDFRWLGVLVVCLGMPGAGFASEQSGVLRRISCPVVRHYVAKYSAPAAEQWARSKGASEAEIEAARRCLRPDTMQAAKAPPSRPLALGSYSW
jgi:hypothetical protein